MLPPEMMGGGPPPGVYESMMGMVGGGGPPPAPPSGADVSEDHLGQAIEHVQAALVAEPDNADSQLLAQVVQTLYKIRAQRDKATQQVMGSPAAQRVISRSYG